MGCAFDPAIIYSNYFFRNPDAQDPELSTKNGIYEPHCGIDNVHMSWGHDEYMAMAREAALCPASASIPSGDSFVVERRLSGVAPPQVMTMNGSTLPPAAVAIVRYHSCYSIHRRGARAESCWLRCAHACPQFPRPAAANGSR